MLSEPSAFLVEPRLFASSTSPVAAASAPHHVLPTSNAAAACGAPGLGVVNGFCASEKANDGLIGPLHVTCVLVAGLARD